MKNSTDLNKLKIIYGIASLAFLVVLAISPLKDLFRQWRDYQKEYNQVVARQPVRIKPVNIAFKQLWVRDLDRVDRCITCHLGVQNSKLASVPQPFRTHPKIYHEINKYGCTICHQGQGLATELADAHLASEFWDKPVLPNRYLESSCGQCHINEKLPDTPNLNRGRELIGELSCVACHELPGFKKSFAPSLDGIGRKVRRNWMVQWLKNPSAYRPTTKMPNFLLSDEEIEVLADFLMSFKNFPKNVQLEPLPQIYQKSKDEDSFIKLGQTRFREARCISCHEVEGRGGHLAPDLAKMASKASAQWIFNYLKNPKRLQPGVEMPQFGFSDKEIAAVTAYIEAEFVDWDAPEEDTTQVHQPVPNFYEKGLAIFNKYNCAGCHRLSAEKIIENKGPELTAIGSKRNYQIDFGKTNIPHTLFNYIEAKLKEPRSFGANMRMPLFNLSDEERSAITTALLAQKSESLPLQYVKRRMSPPEFNPQGQVGKIIRKYSCLKCHTIKGTGGKIAPDLSIVGSQLRRDWVQEYFKVPYSLRPIVEERMPNLFISEPEVKTLTNYFYSVLVNDSLSSPQDWNFSKEAQARGKGLFWEKYGCQSCHIVGGKGGYVGPPLDRAGERLQPGWVFHWLLDPQKYKPKTLEPRTGMTKEEARDLVAYLMSLRSKS